MPTSQTRALRGGFTLLEVVIVLFIVSLVLGAVYTIAQGTLTLADDVRRAQMRDSRRHAFAAWFTRQVASLPATGSLSLVTTQEQGRYVSALDLRHVPSPFDGTPGCAVKLFTEPTPGGGLRLRLSCRKPWDETPGVSLVLFDSLEEFECRVFDPGSKQWTTIWNQPPVGGEPNPTLRPLLLETTMSQGGDAAWRQVCWIPPPPPAFSSPTGVHPPTGVPAPDGTRPIPEVK